MGRVMGLVGALWLLATPLWGAAGPMPRPVLLEIVGSGSGGEARFEIRADRPLNFSFYTMPELLKGVVDLPGAQPGKLEPVRKVAAGPVGRILVREKELNGEPGTRLIFDLTRDAQFQVAADPLEREKLVVRLTPPAASESRTLPAVSPAVPAGKPLASLPAPVVPSPGGAGDTPGSQTLPAAARLVSAVRVAADSLEIVSDGRLTGATVFPLKKPGRLVVDLAGARSAVTAFATPANRFGITRGRLGLFAGKLRIVFETADDNFLPFTVSHSATGLRIVPALSSSVRKP